MSDKNKDDIISAQLEIIKTMTENNLRRVGDDLAKAGVSLRPGTDAVKEPEETKKAENAEDKKAEDKKANTPSEAKVKEKVGSGENPEELPAEKIEDLLEELDTYIGLEKVKSEVKGLINLAKVYALRRENGLPVGDISLHMVFSGNPGTGKTMMARFMARVYHSLGLLKKGHLVECDRAGLVAGYVGQTAVKTEKLCREALGGVLFIDEAYTLASKGENDFGTEAVDTLLKFMEDNRGDIVVIAAGYTSLMRGFIASNPGLESRFNKYLEFEDYSADEMADIFALNCKKGMYNLTDGAAERAASYFREKEHDGDFGNARGVRNFFERTLAAQANRIAAEENVTREILSCLTAEDIESAAVCASL